MPDELIGVQIGGYVIREKLDTGGMGAVYLAAHARLNEYRVIKVLLPHVAVRPEIVARFEREAIATSRLHHPNILEIHELGLHNGQPWIMSEYLQGQSLDKLLKSGPLTVHRALAVVLQLCAALEHAHLHGVIHRDIKPSNVFFCPTEREPFRIKLFDFGIAKMLDASDGAHTHAGVGCGTPNYMAVEQYQHADQADARSDIYAVAVVTTELVTGRLPWGIHEVPQVAYFLQKTEQPYMAGVPDGWIPTIRAALQVNPDDRPQSARAFAMALAAATPEGMTLVRALTPAFWRTAQPGLAPHDVLTLAPPPPITLALPTPPPAPATTISLSTGVLALPPPRRAHLAILALVVATLAGVATFTLTRHVPQAASMPPPPPPPPQPAPAPTPVPVSTPDAAPPDAAPPAPPPAPPPPRQVVRKPPPPPPTDTFNPYSPTGK